MRVCYGIGGRLYDRSEVAWLTGKGYSIVYALRSECS